MQKIVSATNLESTCWTLSIEKEGLRKGQTETLPKNRLVRAASTSPEVMTDPKGVRFHPTLPSGTHKSREPSSFTHVRKFQVD